MSNRYVVMTSREAVAAGADDDYASDDEGDDEMVLVDVMRMRIVYWDGGEPEDMRLTRNLSNLVDELNRVAGPVA